MRAFLAVTALSLFGFPALADHTLIHSLGGIHQGEAPNPLPAVDTTPRCESTPVFPTLATDGADVLVTHPDAEPNLPVLLRGYAYANAPTASLPEGDGRRQIYCSCRRLDRQIARGIDGSPDTIQSVLRLPSNVPTGHYSIEVLEPGSSCDVGGIGAMCDEPAQCLRPSLTIAPAFITVTANNLDFQGNSEPVNRNPAEMQFTFAAASGVKPGNNSIGNSVAEFRGAFPAGTEGRSHLTNSDNTVLQTSIPLFSAAEDRLLHRECREECASSAFDTNAQACLTQCDGKQSTFNGLINVGLSGIERDTSPDTGWTQLAGAAAAALVCYKTGDCLDSVGNPSSAIGLGEKVSDLLKGLVGEDDDDKLGSIESVFDADVDDWGINSPVDATALGGGSSGDVRVLVTSRRDPAPSLTKFDIVIDSVRLNEGYEVAAGNTPSACRGANDIVLHVQAFAGGKVEFNAPRRIPDSDQVHKMRPGDRWTIEENILSHRAQNSGRAFAFPYLYLSVGVWEEDGALSPDLIGYGTATHFFGDLVKFPGTSAAFFNDENRLVRRIILNQSMFVNGYSGSDRDCFAGVPLPGSNQTKGHAEISYRIEAEYLVSPDSPRN